MVKRGDIRWYTFKPPDKKRPVLILTRDSVIPYLSQVSIAPVTSTVRDIPSEVFMSREDGMPVDCAINFDHIQNVPRAKIGDLILITPADKMKATSLAIRFALDLYA